MSEQEKRKEKEEFEKLSRQFIDFLYNYGNPHSMIIIEQTGARFFSGELGISFELRDEQTK